jgi:nucleoside-diphosphate-sugar epimerase
MPILEQAMNILITGSSGFLGSHLAVYFRSQGHHVTGVDTVPSATTDIVHDVVAYLEHCSTKFGLLLHFAATVGGRENIEKNYLDIVKNIELDRIVFEWAVRHVEHIVYPSSSAVYPVNFQNEEHVFLSESMIDFENNCIGVSDHLYGWSKLTSERMLWQIHKTTDLRVHIVRPFSGYGPGQTLLYPMTNLINNIKTRPNSLQVWGNGEQTRDWVYITDIIRVIDWCSTDSAKYFTLNIGTGVATKFVELIDIIYQLKYQKICPEIQRLQDRPVGVMHRVADITLLRRLGLLPVINLEQGIKSLL